MATPAERIANNFARIGERVARAAEASGRPATAVRIVGVTKYVGPPEVEALLAAGCRDLGESRPQALWERVERFPSPEIRWHLIGHLQRNKIRRTLPLVCLIHSVDSARLLAALDEEAAQLGRPVELLVEINISGEAAKTGLPPEQLPDLLADVHARPFLRVRGLMGMAPLDARPEIAARAFASLRELRDRLRATAPANASLGELSMGMSDDFEIAIAEGATLVRIGSRLFE